MTKPFIRRKPFYPPSSASVERASSSPHDALSISFLDRVSYFETLRAYGGRIFSWQEHWERLKESCLGAGQPLDSNGVDAHRWVLACLKESGYPDALLRISVHRSEAGAGEFVLMIRPFTAHPAALYENGVALKTAVMRRSLSRAQDPQIKASQFMTGVLASIDETGERAHELVFLGAGETGLSEGTVSNLFIVKGKRLLTPPASSGILRGVTRRFVIGLAQKRGIATVETPLSRHDVYVADECFITNTSSEILPVVSLDGRMIGDGRPGETTRLLSADFKNNTRETQ
jgi:branched-chain amino acid aminotransferase